ncbi:hypothetical protein [Moraxella lacunata]|uniref:hypothetical protein n=1 Tax=Moraxella lacunata TaxID=477 RepID=UPI003EE3283D
MQNCTWGCDDEWEQNGYSGLPKNQANQRREPVFLGWFLVIKQSGYFSWRDK